MTGIRQKRFVGLASVKGSQIAVVGGAIRRNQTFRRKSADPTTRLSKSQKSIRKGTFNLNRVYDPSSNAESF